MWNRLSRLFAYEKTSACRRLDDAGGKQKEGNDGFCMFLFYVLEGKQFCLVIGKRYCSLPKKKGGWAAITASPYIAAKLVFTEEGVS